MTTPGSVNSVGEQANDNINSERRDSNPYATLTRKFVSSKLKNKRKRAWFVESVNRDGEMTPELLEQIRDFAWTHTDFSGLTIDASNITYSSLQKELSSYVSSLNNNREQVKNRFLQENHISASESEKLIRKKIENLEEPELTRFW